MKKILCLILVAVLSLAALPVFAADTAGLENAIATVKSRIEIPPELSDFSSNVQTNDSGVNVYDLQWSTVEGSEPQKRLETEIDSYGSIIRYNYYVFENSYSEKASLPKLSKDELIDAAYAHLSRLNPDLAPEFSPEGEILHGYGVNSPSATVRFDRYVNGIEFQNNYADVTLGSDTAELVQLTMNLIYAQSIPAPENIITPEQAAEKFTELSPMTAKYITKYAQGEDENAAILVYQPKDTGLMINAFTGEEFKLSTYGYNAGGQLYGDASEAALSTADSSAVGFTPEELANLEQVEGLKSEEEIRAIVESMTELPIENKEFSKCSYNSRRSSEGGYEYTANLTYTLSEVRGDMSVREDTFVSLDAKTGELIEVQTYDNINDGAAKPALTEAQALDAAKAFAAKYAPNQYTKVNTDVEASGEIAPEWEYYRDYSFYLYRTENGFDYSENYIYIAVDKTGGKIKQFRKEWDDDIAFESPDGIISPDEAFAALSSECGIEPLYVADSSDGKTYTANLVYALPYGKTSIVSAKTGALLDYDGSEYKKEEEAKAADDISGHYAETAISVLLGSGVLSMPNGETSFRPDDVITQSELIEFVSALEGERYPYVTSSAEVLYKYASGRGIIKDGEARNAEQPCTREDGVKYIIRALGYEEIALLTDIFVTGFADSADITPGMEGYVALAKGYGIVGGNPDNTFAPKLPLTRADAALMIYNYLSE